MTQWDRGHGTPAIPDPFGVAVEHDEEFEPALALHHNIRMVAVGIPEEVLDRIDLDALGVTSNPECPDELRCLLVWAVRSNICTLYTSPNPSDRTRSRMPAYA